MVQDRQYISIVQGRSLNWLSSVPKGRIGILVVYDGTFETTGFDGADHAVETMDATIEALSLLSEYIP